MAGLLGVTQRAWAAVGRVSVAKVAEYQARGVVHLPRHLPPRRPRTRPPAAGRRHRRAARRSHPRRRRTSPSRPARLRSPRRARPRSLGRTTRPAPHRQRDRWRRHHTERQAGGRLRGQVRHQRRRNDRHRRPPDLLPDLSRHRPMPRGANIHSLRSLRRRRPPPRIPTDAPRGIVEARPL